METLLKTSAKLVATRACRIKSDVSKMLASEKRMPLSLRSAMHCNAMVHAGCVS